MSRHGTRRIAIDLLVILAITLMAVTPSLAQEEPPAGWKATPLTPAGSMQVAKTVAPGSSARLVSVIVKLKGPGLAAYTGGIGNLAPTSPSATGGTQLNVTSAASQAYLRYLAQEQAQFVADVAKAAPQAQVTHQLNVVLNAVSLVIPQNQVSSLAGLANVESVIPDELLHLDTDNSPQFIGAPTVWNQLGGQEAAGDNVIVAVLDTGIWPEHPSFSDPDPSGKPYAAPPPPLAGTRACQFSGGTNPGSPFTCNNKLIAAQRFMSTYDAVVGVGPGEFTSARDDDGHGTHTSSTAAGNASVAAKIFNIARGMVSGIAPRAHVMMYKVCGATGCFGSDSAAALQEAILDGANTVNFSISGGANPFSDPVELAFLDAYAAGVFVAASAGNAGPGLDTTDHRGPWTTTVAASTQNRAFETTATVTAGTTFSLTLTGTSITQGITTTRTMTVPVTDQLCVGPFAPGTFTGKVVICERGNNGRVDKGYQVLQGGAAGMILYNQAADVTDLETDNHFLPAVQIQYDQGGSLLDFLTAHPGATVTWPAGAKVAAQGDVMASFSSRGGPGQSLGVSKPDITAPGVQILAGAAPAHWDIAAGPQGELFQAIAGTSMSGPHIAGAGALIKALHPDWTPGQIKSALMATAWTQVVEYDGTTPANAFDYGSGRVNLNKAGDPGLTFSASAIDFVTHAADLWTANYPSVYVPALAGQLTVQRTAHSQVNAETRWAVSVQDQSATDFTITVPDQLIVPAGGDAPFNIDIDGRAVPVGQVRMATVYLTESDTNGTRQLHLPVTFIRQQAVVTLDKTCTPAAFAIGSTVNCTVTATNTTFDAATASVADQLPPELKLVPGSVVGALPAGNGVQWFDTLAGAEPPAITIGPGNSPAGGYLPLSAFGIPPVTGVGDETVTNFIVPAFTYGGETYTRIGFVSNGYAIVGGAAGTADIQFINQNLPDPTRPNNVLAPFWTDLNPGVAGALRIGTLTDNVSTWLVLDWAGVKEYSRPVTNTFQIWIGLDSNPTPGQDVTFAYGPINGTGDGNHLTVGAENRFGNRGGNYYYNQTGTLPANGTELRVAGAAPTPGETHVIRYAATGVKAGSFTNYARLTSSLFQGTSTASASGTVLGPDVYVQKTGPATARVGDVITYTVTLGNQGTAPATGVMVTDTLFAGIVPASQMTLTFPLMPSGYITTIAKALTLPPPTAGLTLTNHVEITALGDTDPGNNSAEVKTFVNWLKSYLPLVIK
jgi:uncharacterized repeat protein (TIGR01451 family)